MALAPALVGSFLSAAYAGLGGLAGISSMLSIRPPDICEKLLGVSFPIQLQYPRFDTVKIYASVNILYPFTVKKEEIHPVVSRGGEIKTLQLSGKQHTDTLLYGIEIPETCVRSSHFGDIVDAHEQKMASERFKSNRNLVTAFLVAEIIFLAMTLACFWVSKIILRCENTTFESFAKIHANWSKAITTPYDQRIEHLEQKIARLKANNSGHLLMETRDDLNCLDLAVMELIKRLESHGTTLMDISRLLGCDDGNLSHLIARLCCFGGADIVSTLECILKEIGYVENNSSHIIGSVATRLSKLEGRQFASHLENLGTGLRVSSLETDRAASKARIVALETKGQSNV
ncbi:hypothetical protein BDV96DRAFT_639257 [Lophiotrema nucula]|uniref:Uncharacterized protein n=1 Tax=Lophiotrema nucula TaxID=690887 RepID=A0A6A5ZUD4_9PLEO|nr:hypothetical protein BDV96DRAFT_639257 [Lophiotrema nucula]